MDGFVLVYLAEWTAVSVALRLGKPKYMGAGITQPRPPIRELFELGHPVVIRDVEFSTPRTEDVGLGVSHRFH